MCEVLVCAMAGTALGWGCGHHTAREEPATGDGFGVKTLRIGEPFPPLPPALRGLPANHKLYPRPGRPDLRDASGAELSHWLAALAGAGPRRAGGSGVGAAVSWRDVGAQRGAARAGRRRRGRGQRQLRGGRCVAAARGSAAPGGAAWRGV